MNSKFKTTNQWAFIEIGEDFCNESLFFNRLDNMVILVCTIFIISVLYATANITQKTACPTFNLGQGVCGGSVGGNPSRGKGKKKEADDKKKNTEEKNIPWWKNQNYYIYGGIVLLVLLLGGIAYLHLLNETPPSGSGNSFSVNEKNNTDNAGASNIDPSASQNMLSNSSKDAIASNTDKGIFINKENAIALNAVAITEGSNVDPDVQKMLGTLRATMCKWEYHGLIEYLNKPPYDNYNYFLHKFNQWPSEKKFNFEEFIDEIWKDPFFKNHPNESAMYDKCVNSKFFEYARLEQATRLAKR